MCLLDSMTATKRTGRSDSYKNELQPVLAPSLRNALDRSALHRKHSSKIQEVRAGSDPSTSSGQHHDRVYYYHIETYVYTDGYCSGSYTTVLLRFVSVT